MKVNGLRIEELTQAVTEIDNDEMVGFGRAFLSLFGVVTKRDSREHTISQIKTKLEEYRRQIYIFIDDCDRLQKKELLQVLSLIRNTGDFPNLTYILAFDKDIVKKLIDDEHGLSYVGKMINLPIELPPITDDIISDYLLSAVKDIIGYKGDITNPFERIQITKHLPTVREAKRYLNLLSSDYKREEGKFGRYHLNIADFCLLELVKYKMSEFYYRLKSSPESYLDLSYSGWNSPTWLPGKNSFEEGNENRVLLKAMLREVTDPNDHYGMIGVANKEYFPLYFEGTSDFRYVYGDEFVDALYKEDFPKRMGKWLVDGHDGVLGLLCIAQGYLSRKELFLSMAEYIWHQCEKGNTVNSLGQLTAGYDNTHFRHSYRNIRKLIANTPQIHLLTFQNMDREDNADMEFTDGIGLNLEMMGIWMNELRHTKNLDYPYSEVKAYNKVMGEVDGRGKR